MIFFPKTRSPVPIPSQVKESGETGQSDLQSHSSTLSDLTSTLCIIIYLHVFWIMLLWACTIVSHLSQDSYKFSFQMYVATLTSQ